MILRLKSTITSEDGPKKEIQEENRVEELFNKIEKMYEQIKRGVFDAGVDAIEELLGCELEFETDEEMVEAMDDALGRMPKETVMEFYNKYCVKKQK